MSTELNSIKGTLLRLGLYPDEKSLLSDAFRALFEISLWGAARAAGCNLEEFKEILRSRGIVIKVSSTKEESDARLKRFTGV